MKTLWIVRWEVTESGWGNADFTAEIYHTEAAADSRAAELNKGKPAHCGYFFTVEPATLVPQ